MKLPTQGLSLLHKTFEVFDGLAHVPLSLFLNLQSPSSSASMTWLSHPLPRATPSKTPRTEMEAPDTPRPDRLRLRDSTSRLVDHLLPEMWTGRKFVFLAAVSPHSLTLTSHQLKLFCPFGEKGCSENFPQAVNFLKPVPVTPSSSLLRFL